MQSIKKKNLKTFCVLMSIIVTSCNGQKLISSITSSPINLDSTNLSQEKPYVQGSDDIPLFARLELIEEDSSNFDTVLGNIVISKYISDSSPKLIKDFYLQTLPQLGWKLVDNKKDKVSFKRERDKLEIKLIHVEKNLYVWFFISSVLQ